jgi:tripartite-type tricarboxylate transporter receptor subunit TctC
MVPSRVRIADSAGLNVLAAVALAAAALALSSPSVCAQLYPSQDIHFISGFPAGSGADVMVRYFAHKLCPLADRTVIVENKPGANGNIAIEYVARAKPDGYTIMVHAGSGIAGNQHLFKKPPVDAAKQLRIVATINRQAFVLTVASQSPHTTVAELTAAMKAKGDNASFGSNSVQSRIAGALYKKVAGLHAVEVQYKSGPDTLREMQSGSIDYAFHDPQLAMTQAAQGRLRLLAICSAERLKMAPELSTMAENGFPQFNLVGWFAATVPAQTPRPVVDKINAWFNAVLATEESREFLRKFGSDVWISTPDEAQAFFLQDIKTWGENVRISGIEPQ